MLADLYRNRGDSPDRPDPRVYGRGPASADLRAADAAAAVMRRDVPGYPTDDRLRQTQNFRGLPYLAIHTLAELTAGGTLRAMRRRKPGKTIRKALPTPQYNASDEQYGPCPDGHPLCQLLDEPSASTTPFDLIYDITVQLYLTGTAILWVRPSVLDTPCELYCIPTALAYPQNPSWQYPMGFYRVSNWHPGAMGLVPGVGSQFNLDGREVARLRFRHPLWRWDGYSPLTALGQQIDVHQSIDESRKSAMDNGLTPDLFVNVQNASEQALSRIEAKLQARSGSARFRGVMAFDGDRMQVTPGTPAPKDMDYQSGWEQSVKMLLAGFKLPPVVAGIAGSSTYSELFAALKQLRVLTGEPLARRIGEFLTRSVARRFDRRCKVQLDLPTLDDPTLQEQQIGTDVGAGTITVNELRSLRGRPPVEGGDVPPKVYEQVLISKLQPQQPDPSATGPVDGSGGGGGGGADVPPPKSNDGGGTHPQVQAARDELMQSVLASLGVPTQKAAQYDESKHPRKGGKFAPKGQGGSGGSDSAGEAAKRLPQFKAAAAKLALKAASLATKATAAAAAAGIGPDEVFGSTEDWQRIQVTHHADVVAHHLGLDAMTAMHLLSHLIAHAVTEVKKHLGKAKPANGTPAPNPAGPRSGAVPGQDNPDGEGSRPPLQKAVAANTLSDPEGGFLVTAGAKRRQKRRVRKWGLRQLDRITKAL